MRPASDPKAKSHYQRSQRRYLKPMNASWNCGDVCGAEGDGRRRTWKQRRGEREMFLSEPPLNVVFPMHCYRPFAQSQEEHGVDVHNIWDVTWLVTTRHDPWLHRSLIVSFLAAYRVPSLAITTTHVPAAASHSASIGCSFIPILPLSGEARHKTPQLQWEASPMSLGAMSALARWSVKVSLGIRQHPCRHFSPAEASCCKDIEMPI